MKEAFVKIKGVKPFLFHKFNINVLTSLTKPKTGSAGNDPEEWKNSFFHKEGKLYIPSEYMFSSLKNGSVHTKAGRGTIQKTWISGILIKEEQIFFNREMFKGWEDISIDKAPVDSTLPIYIDIRMVANPNTKGRNVRYRLALSPGWELSFTLLVDTTLLSIPQVKKVVEDTGKMQGIADGRTLGFGRFELISFELEG